MNNISVFDFNGQEVRFVGTPEKPEWVAQDVCNVLDIANSRDALSRLEDYQKGSVAIPDISLSSRKTITVNTVTTDGLKVLVAKSRSPKAQEMARQLGMDIYVSSIEADCIRILTASFKDLNPVRQFNVHGYKIDLYLSQANIAIECDEFGHRSKDSKSEYEREKIIKSALRCSFVRFNPNKPGFNIGDVVNEIRNIIL